MQVSIGLGLWLLQGLTAPPAAVAKILEILKGGPGSGRYPAGSGKEKITSAMQAIQDKYERNMSTLRYDSQKRITNVRSAVQNIKDPTKIGTGRSHADAYKDYETKYGVKHDSLFGKNPPVRTGFTDPKGKFITRETAESRYGFGDSTNNRMNYIFSEKMEKGNPNSGRYPSGVKGAGALSRGVTTHPEFSKDAPGSYKDHPMRTDKTDAHIQAHMDGRDWDHSTKATFVTSPYGRIAGDLVSDPGFKSDAGKAKLAASLNHVSSLFEHTQRMKGL